MKRFARILTVAPGVHCVAIRDNSDKIQFHFRLKIPDGFLETTATLSFDHSGLVAAVFKKKHKPILLERAKKTYAEVLHMVAVHDPDALEVGTKTVFDNQILQKMLPPLTEENS